MAAEAESVGFWDRLFPWRAEDRERKAKINGHLKRMKDTVDGIKQDHGLDQLVVDIESARRRGAEAMRQDHERRRRDSQPG